VKRTWMLATGLALAVIGLGGCAVLGAAAMASRHVARRGGYETRQGWDGTAPRLDLQQPTPSANATTGASAGEILYLTGIGHGGAVPYTGGPAWFQRTGHGCVGCHGVDGLSRAVTSVTGGQVATGDIRYDSLAGLGVTAESTATIGGWSDEDIAVAIIKGVTPDGTALDPTMPLWQMDETDMASLLEYLKELSSR
jgi:mono/diheme cytochrome c family protein